MERKWWRQLVPIGTLVVEGKLGRGRLVDLDGAMQGVIRNFV